MKVVSIAKVFCSLILGAVMVTGCFTPHQPYYHNDEDEFVEIKIEHEDGYVGQGEIGPRANLASAHPVESVTSIQISYNEGPEFILDREDIRSIREMEGFPKFEVWILSKEGIRLGSKKDWKRILEEKQDAE